MVTKAFSYTRMSSKKQIKGDSLRRQLKKAHDAAAEHDWILDDSLQDIGVSGYTGKHIDDGELGRFIEMCEGGEIENGSVLIIENLDRFSRQRAAVAFTIFWSILETGVDIYICDERRLFTEDNMDMGNLFMTIGGMIRANEESKRKGDMIGLEWARKRADAKNKILSVRCPAWLQISEDKTHFTIIKERQKTIHYIYKLCLEGNGYNAITTQLNTEQVPMFNKGKGWHSSYVLKILRGKEVLGHFQPRKTAKRIPDGDVIEDYFPAVIDEETYYQAQKAIDSRVDAGKGRKGKKYSNIFTGIIKCGECRGSMMFKKHVKKKRPNYEHKTLRCYSASMGVCEHNEAHRYDDIEVLVLKNLRRLAITTLSKPQKSKRKIVLENLDTDRGKLATVTKRRERLLLQYADSDSDDETVLGVIAKLGEDEKKLKKSVAQLTESLKKVSMPTEHTSAVVGNIEAYMKLIEGADEKEVFRVRNIIAAELKKIVKKIDIYNDGSVAMEDLQTGELYFLTDMADKELMAARVNKILEGFTGSAK